TFDVRPPLHAVEGQPHPLEGVDPPPAWLPGAAPRLRAGLAHLRGGGGGGGGGARGRAPRAGRRAGARRAGRGRPVDGGGRRGPAGGWGGGAGGRGGRGGGARGCVSAARWPAAPNGPWNCTLCWTAPPSRTAWRRRRRGGRPSSWRARICRRRAGGPARTPCA